MGENIYRVFLWQTINLYQIQGTNNPQQSETKSSNWKFQEISIDISE